MDSFGVNFANVTQNFETALAKRLMSAEIYPHI